MMGFTFFFYSLFEQGGCACGGTVACDKTSVYAASRSGGCGGGGVSPCGVWGRGGVTMRLLGVETSIKTTKNTTRTNTIITLQQQNPSKHERKQTEKFKDLSPTQLTVSNSSQSSVDSVRLFISDLSQAVIVLHSVMECAVVWVQCMYILALPLDIDSVDQCHNLYNTCSDLKLAKSVTKHSL